MNITNMNSIALKSKPYLEYPVYIFFVFVYPFLFIRYGLDYTDSPFLYLGYIEYGHGHQFGLFRLIFLTTFIGAWWANLFGDSIISFRILATILKILSIIIPVSVILRKGYALKIKLRYMALAVILSVSLFSYILNYGIITSFFLSLLTTAFLLYLRNGGYLLLVSVGILTALAVAARFPSIVALFFVLIALSFQLYTKKTSIKESFTLIASYIITFVVGFFVLKNMFISAETLSPELGGSYSILKLLKSYLRDGLIIFEMMAVLSLLALISIKSRALSLSATYIRGALSTVFIYYFLKRIISSHHNVSISLFYSAIILWVLLLLLYDSYRKNNQDDIVVYLYCTMVGFVGALGSDTGLLKLNGAYIPLLPILIYKLRYVISKNDTGNIRLLFFLVISLSIYNKVGLGKAYQDKPMKQLTAEVNHDKLRWIKTSKERKEQIESILSTAARIKEHDPNASFMFYGSKAYLFTYLTDSKTLFPTLFYMLYDNKDDEQRMSNYLSQNSSRPYVFLIFDYPDRPIDMDGGLIKKSLIRYGYNQINGGINYQVYATNKKHLLYKR